jgi:ABC-2 type transport system ATP-binding protein
MVEGPAFFGALSGAANLQLLASLNGPVTKARVSEVLNTVGLGDAGRKPFRAYSLGMKQRLGIAMALVGSPELVILDEPTNGLDPNGIHEMRSLIHELNARDGVTFIISSHLLHEIEMVCNKVAILEHGRLIVEDQMESLIGGTERHTLCASPATVASQVIEEATGHSPHQNSDALNFDMPSDQLPDLIRSLTQANVDIRSLSENRRTLEDFFLDRSRTTSDGRLS